MINVASRARRILSHLAQYQAVSTESLNAPQWIQEISLQEGEACLGIYVNLPGKVEESIVVTNLGLHIRRDKQWEFVSYTQIKSVETPTNKQDVTQLIIHLSDGQDTRIPVRGGQGRFQDAFEFLRFLDRVTDDLRSKDTKNA